MDLIELLQHATRSGASDLHLIAGLPPVLRIYGDIIATEYPPLSGQDTEDLVTTDLSEEQRAKLATTQQLCYSLKVPDVGYFRVSLYYEQGTLGAAIRIGMTEVRRPEMLGLPPIVEDLARRTSGLLLITGPTGSGKTTTMNAIIDQINRERKCKIISVEDPIEYLHANKRSIVVQQEVYSDTPSFAMALIHILRQDPDVIAVGEMRDLDTISTALTAAETGHLVISTLHTPDASQTVNRILDVFPSEQQNQIRAQFSAALQAVVAQQLLPRVDTAGRVLCCEVLVATPAVRNIIREGRLQQLPGAIQTGRNFGMQLMDDGLRDLYQRGVITYDTAMTRAAHPEYLRLRDTDAGALSANEFEGRTTP